MTNRSVDISFASNPSLPETLRFQQDFHRALGYAIAWGNSDHVSIFVDKEGDIQTSHQRNINPDKDGTPTYQQYFFMLGLRNKEDVTKPYTFHS